MSGLSKKELENFLEEVNAEQKEELKIGGITLREAHERAIQSRRNKAAERKAREKEIIQEAINSTFIDLNAPMSMAHKKLLVKLITDDYTELMQKHEAYINRRITKMLELVIPSELLNTYRNYKECVVPAISFKYVASKEYGQGLPFTVTLDLPMYFHPEDIQRILKENWPERLVNVDKAIVSFHKNKDIRTKREVTVAQQLTKISTFYQLVKKNPFWYDKLVQELKKQYSEQNACSARGE